MKFFEALLKKLGWTEYAIGLFEHEFYNVIFDTNGMSFVMCDLDERAIAYESDEASDMELINFLAKSDEYRADEPF